MYFIEIFIKVLGTFIKTPKPDYFVFYFDNTKICKQQLINMIHYLLK